MKKPSPVPRAEQRIAKLLARAGIASRREIERMIAEGRVALNGQPIDTPATLLASLHGVTVDGQPVKPPAPARLFRFHKPPGLLTTERDPAGRPTIYDRLPKDLPRVMPVGRLDLNTEGLLLLTTDGELKRQLELPSTGITRSYRARAFGDVSQEQLEELIHGVEIDGIRYGSIDANLERRTGRNQWIELRLTEGKNREVRRVLEHLGLQVSRLLRTSYGPFPLADLPPGAVDEVRQHDLVAFRASLRGGGMLLPEPEAHSARPDAPAERRAAARRRPSAAGAASPPRAPRRPSPTRDPAAAPAAGPRRRPQPIERDALVDRPKRPPRGSAERPGRASQSEAPPPSNPSAARPVRLKRGAGWAKPKPKGGSSSRPTPRGGGGGKRQPGRGRPSGAKK